MYARVLDSEFAQTHPRTLISANKCEQCKMQDNNENENEKQSNFYSKYICTKIEIKMK